MAVAYLDKQLVGSGTITSYTNLYATGASTTALVSALVLCNETTSAITVRIGLSPTNGTTAPATGRFIAYDLSVPPAASGPLILNLPITMGNTKYLNCSSSSAGITFTAAVGEVS